MIASSLSPRGGFEVFSDAADDTPKSVVGLVCDRVERLAVGDADDLLRIDRT